MARIATVSVSSSPRERFRKPSIYHRVYAIELKTGAPLLLKTSLDDLLEDHVYAAEDAFDGSITSYPI